MAEIVPANITDHGIRQQALEPETSFIVQAPAGSGKTELLTQRFLQMLAIVDAPEEILAVTFTRKAAAEMRNRIISAIYPPPGEDTRLEQTVELAEAVLDRDRQMGWHLQQYPARLRIRTIDSVNAWLSSTAPIFGQGSGAVSDTPFDLYREAAMRTVQQITETGSEGEALRKLLQHLDNRTHTLIALLTRMLARRDQWLPFVFDIGRSDAVRDELEATLHELVTRELEAACACIPPDYRESVVELLRFVGANLAPEDEAWLPAEELTTFPAPEPEQLGAWQLIAELLLTKGGQIRKTVDVRSGFPPGDGENAARKEQARALFAAVSETEQAAEILKVLRILPVPVYSDEQWALLKDLLEVLHQSAGELLLVFAEQGEADYPAVAQNAMQALSGEDGPTDLALRLDYVIRHILIDEFQDTSSAQLDLLKALTAGWSAGDGRTLFLVGDPMQSIYRFRKAEVGLFLDLQDPAKGLPNVQLRPLRLETNFRSDPVVVNWVNSVFSQVMPEQGDRTSGAVEYAPSVAARGSDSQATVSLHPLLKPSRNAEAEQVVELIERTLHEYPPGSSDPVNANKSIGVLVRARAHAGLIARGLRDKGIRFSGTGLENSIDTQVVQDLLCLTRALTHRADRTAWLGMLRAPWCGLTLVDLETLAGGRKDSVWELLCDAGATDRLSADGQRRVERLTEVLKPIFSRRGALPLRDVVEGVWVELGGPAFLEAGQSGCPDLQRAEAFFDVLDGIETGGDAVDAFHLHEQLADQLAIEDAGAPVNLLTIHKAKGLEFDTVILPALEVTPPGPEKPVLAWQEIVRPNGEPGLVIAPVESMGDEQDRVFGLARRLNAAQDSNEKDRLLYVAATRARLRLHLFYGLGLDKEGEPREPARSSLIGRLWPALDASRSRLPDDAVVPPEPEEWIQPVIRRFKDAWRVPAAPAPCSVQTEKPDSRLREVSYDWAGSTAMHVGSVTHRWLQLIAEQGVDNFDEARIDGLRPVFRIMLTELDVVESELDAAVNKVVEGLTGTLRDAKGQWLLSGDHSDAVCEYAVTVMRDSRIESMVIDRTFVDAEGVRWIVDYKASTHEGGGLAEFIEEQKRRYSEQLEGYRYAMQLLEPEREIKTALYFPLLRELHEVSPD